MTYMEKALVHSLLVSNEISMMVALSSSHVKYFTIGFELLTLLSCYSFTKLITTVFRQKQQFVLSNRHSQDLQKCRDETEKVFVGETN